MTIKKFVFQAAIIIIIGLGLGLTFNLISSTPLPIFKKYNAQLFPGAAKNKTTDNKSVYFQEVDEPFLKQLMENNEAILLDARNREVFNQKHIPSAINLPVSEFEKFYKLISDQLITDKIIITYCISETCTDSIILARKLHKKKGHKNIMIYKN